MAVQLNEVLNSFRALSSSAQDADDRVIVNGDTVATGAKDVGWSKRAKVMQEGGITQAQQNNDVRTMLMNALRNQFANGIPENVRRALVGSGKCGANDMKESSGAVTSGRPLTMRRIREVIQAVETEISDTQAKEKAAQRGNLEFGLLAGDTKVADGNSLDNLVNALEQYATGEAVEELREAQATCRQARMNLAGVTGKDLANNVNNAREYLAAVVEAEANLAEKITVLTGEIRKSLKGARNNFLEELGALDDLAMSTELNAAKIERLGAELMEVKDNGVVDRLVLEFNALIIGASPLESARAAIENYVATATPLLEEIANLETMPPDAATAQIAGRLNEALNSAEAALANLENLKGVDLEAVRQLRANLTAAKNTLTTCGARIREKMLEGMTCELVQMLKDSRALLEDKYYQDPTRGELKTFADKFIDYIKDEWLPTLENGTVEAKEEIFHAVCEKIREGNQDAKCSRVLLRSGLTKFLDKYAARQALMQDTSSDDPFSQISAKLLAQAFRGEIDVMNYLSLKTAGYTDEMFWADLIVKPGSNRQRVGSGSFNEVHKIDMQNVRTGATETVILKDVELSGGNAKNSVAGYFSSDEAVVKTDKINVATSKAASLIGCGRQITRCGMVHIGDRYRLAQEMAPGDTVWNAIKNHAKVFEIPDPDHPDQRKTVNLAEGYASLSDAAKEKFKVELQLAAAKLEWADLLTGQIDRSRSNMMIKVNVTGEGDNARVEVILKGIDNDIGFTEGHTGMLTFDVRDDKVQPKGNGVKVDTNKFERSRYNANNTADQRILVNRGIHGLRVPAFLPLSVKRQLDALDEDTFRREMGGLLSEAALKAAIGRLNEMKRLAIILEGDGRLVNDINRAKTPDAKKLAGFVVKNRAWYLDNYELHGALGNIYTEIFHG